MAHRVTMEVALNLKSCQNATLALQIALNSAGHLKTAYRNDSADQQPRELEYGLLTGGGINGANAHP